MFNVNKYFNLHSNKNRKHSSNNISHIYFKFKLLTVVPLFKLFLDKFIIYHHNISLHCNNNCAPNVFIETPWLHSLLLFLLLSQILNLFHSLSISEPPSHTHTCSNRHSLLPTTHTYTTKHTQTRHTLSLSSLALTFE